MLAWTGSVSRVGIVTAFHSLQAPLGRLRDCAMRIGNLATGILSNVDSENGLNEIRRLRRDLPLLVQQAMASLHGGDEMQIVELQHRLSAIKEDAERLADWIGPTWDEMQKIWKIIGTAEDADKSANLRWGKTRDKAFAECEQKRQDISNSCHEANAAANKICKEIDATVATSSAEGSLRTPQQLLEAFGKSAARFPNCPRMLAFLNSSRKDGLVTVPPSFVPRRPDGQLVVGQLNIGGTNKSVFGHNATFYGIGGARVAAETGDRNVGFVLYGADNDEAVTTFRELGGEAGVVIHVNDLIRGIQACDRPLVLWSLIVYETLQGSAWLSQIDTMTDNPAFHFNPFAASVETLKRLLARNEAQARKSPIDVPLDQSTMAEGQAKLAFIDSLAGTNTAMRDLVVGVGARHAGSLHPGMIVAGKTGNLSDRASNAAPPVMMAVQTDPVSRAIALPAIVNAIHELHRTIEFPPGKDWQPPQWLVERHKGEDALLASLKNEPQLHYWLFQEARNELLRLLSPNSDSAHRDADCPEITESNLDQKQKVALLELRKRIKDSFPGNIIDNGAERLQMLDYLESAAKRLGKPGKSGTLPAEQPIPPARSDAKRNGWIAVQTGRASAIKKELDRKIASTEWLWTTVGIARINAIRKEYRIRAAKRGITVEELVALECQQT